MAKNNFSFVQDGADMEGRSGLWFKGIYADYRAEVFLVFSGDQMFRLDVKLWESYIGSLDGVFVNLNKLLTAKYGPLSRDASRNLEVGGGKTRFYVPLITYIWSIDGDAKTITLGKQPEFKLSQSVMEGNVSVSYENIQLLQSLKNMSRQGI